MAEETRPIPLLGDISLDFGQVIEHSVDAGFVSLGVPGLAGEVQQRSARRSHRVKLEGYLHGEEARDQLGTLQEAAAAGEELTFSADITSALDIQRVVITHFTGEELAGRPGVFRYRMFLAESPPLPPPATVEAFGGLDDFGLGDLGFDTDILGDLQDLAGDIAGAVDDALSVIDQLSGLLNLDGLDLNGIFDPLSAPVDTVKGAGGGFKSAVSDLGDAFS